LPCPYACEESETGSFTCCVATSTLRGTTLERRVMWIGAWNGTTMGHAVTRFPIAHGQSWSRLSSPTNSRQFDSSAASNPVPAARLPSDTSDAHCLETGPGTFHGGDRCPRWFLSNVRGIHDAGTCDDDRSVGRPKDLRWTSCRKHTVLFANTAPTRFGNRVLLISRHVAPAFWRPRKPQEMSSGNSSTSWTMAWPESYSCAHPRIIGFGLRRSIFNSGAL